jgi:hypothetical protein
MSFQKVLSTTYLDPNLIKQYASVPDQADMTISGNIVCVKITTAKIKNAVKGSSFSIHDLCNIDGTFVSGGQDGKINVWSRYKPGSLSYASGQTPTHEWDAAPTFTYIKPGHGNAGDFAGYNHKEWTKPVWGGFSPTTFETYKGVPGYTSVPVYSPFARGYMVPVLASNKEDESLWNRVKLKLARSGGSLGIYPATTGVYLDLTTQPQIYTINNGETPGTYQLYVQPWYYDTNNQPLAQCECGYSCMNYIIHSILDFLNDYHFISGSDGNIGGTHDFGAGLVSAFYLSQYDVKVYNNGYGTSKYYNNVATFYFRLHLKGTAGNTGDVYYSIGALNVPYAQYSHIDTPNFATWYNVGGTLTGITAGDLYLQISDDGGATYQDWTNLHSYTW